MGIYSTLDITREDAISEIKKGIENASDDVIAEMLFALYRDKNFYNYSIVSSYENSDRSYNQASPLDFG